MMVEITYQMVLSTLQTAGLLIGILYYILDLQNQREDQKLANARQELMLKSQEQDLETRQAQLYMSLLDGWNTKDFSEQRYEVYRMEFKDYDDFRNKYNSINNPGVFASWNTFGRKILGLAELKRKGLIDIDFLDGMMISDVLNWWRRFGPLEKEALERGTSNWWSHFPFIMEVVEYHRSRYPKFYDENGNRKVPVGQSWIKPEEIMRLRAKIESR